MSDVYYALIIFPILFIGTMSFIFTSSVAELTLQEFRLNCPYPVSNANATIVDYINGNTALNYTLSYSSDMNATGVRFQCRANPGPGPDTGTPQVLISSEEYGAALGNCSTFCIPWGWIGYVSHYATEIGNKIDAFGKMLYLIVTAPAQVSALSWYIYVEVVLFAFIALGGFMVVRG